VYGIRLRMAWTMWRGAWVRGSMVIAVLVGACEVGDDGETGADSNTGGMTSACEMCGETPCQAAGEPAGDCFSEAFCVPPADDACVACMMTNCPDSVGTSCGAFDCVDYAKTIGGCGDATPYAGEHYECMVASCDAECAPGEGFMACACI
jgi:hypothetical protein